MSKRLDDVQLSKASLVNPPSVVHIQSAHCPNGCDLMSEDVKIHAMKSIKVKLRSRNKEGYIYLDPEFGSYKHVSEVDLTEGEIVEFYCPKCGVSLKNETETCRSCSAPTFTFDLPGEGEISGCLRSGCFEHTLKIVSFESMQLQIDEEFVKVIM